MPLKRIYVNNQIYFITTNTFNRVKIFNDEQYCELFLKILLACQKRYKFKIYGHVVMPDHVHLLIQPDEKMKISDCMHRIKGNFAYQYIKTQNHEGSATEKTKFLHPVDDPSWVIRARLREEPIWQKSFYDHIIRNEKDFDQKLDYIHDNPIRAGLVKCADQYKYSSFIKYYKAPKETSEYLHKY